MQGYVSNLRHFLVLTQRHTKPLRHSVPVPPFPTPVIRSNFGTNFLSPWLLFLLPSFFEEGGVDEGGGSLSFLHSLLSASSPPLPLLCRHTCRRREKQEPKKDKCSTALTNRSHYTKLPHLVTQIGGFFLTRLSSKDVQLHSWTAILAGGKESASCVKLPPLFLGGGGGEPPKEEKGEEVLSKKFFSFFKRRRKSPPSFFTMLQGNWGKPPVLCVTADKKKRVPIRINQRSLFSFCLLSSPFFSSSWS